nr:MAG TPA: hypothetical protein [Caudoviricetes sp.]
MFFWDTTLLSKCNVRVCEEYLTTTIIKLNYHSIHYIIYSIVSDLAITNIYNIGMGCFRIRIYNLIRFDYVLWICFLHMNGGYVSNKDILFFQKSTRCPYTKQLFKYTQTYSNYLLFKLLNILKSDYLLVLLKYYLNNYLNNTKQLLKQFNILNITQMYFDYSNIFILKYISSLII